MSTSLLPIHPQEATKALLKTLPSRRMRDVLEKRFGLRGGRKKTLEAIGQEYRITRERVRQIENDALRHLRKNGQLPELQKLFGAVEEQIRDHGEVMAAPHLITTLADQRSSAHLTALLSIGQQFHSLPESDSYHVRWTVNKDKAQLVEKAIAQLTGDMNSHSSPVSQKTLYDMAGASVKSVLGDVPPERALESYLRTSKLIRSNPYGEYGLASWSSINPRGVRDKAYSALVKAGKPMHFREVAHSINNAGWSRKKAHPQTVHNELIKDDRFVLVGRGLYALREWGYEPGVVREVLASILKEVGRPLPPEEIVRLVSEKRLVKPQTVLLNLQNKSLFRRTGEGHYTLV